MNKQITPQTIKKILKLNFNGINSNQISQRLSISRDSVCRYLEKAKAAKLEWPSIKELPIKEVDKIFFPDGENKRQRRYPDPDWDYFHKKIQKKGTTILDAYIEYITANLDGMSQGRFYERYHDYLRKNDIFMYQACTAGEKSFVDYAGDKMEIMNRKSGLIRHAEVFVSSTGCSNLIYAEAHWTQAIPNWINAHVNLFDFLGVVPHVLVCDNLKSAVKHAKKYSPVINDAYADLAEHYDVHIVPGRVRKPKDKARVERAVRIVETKILSKLKEKPIFSLEDANKEIKLLLREVNTAPYSAKTGSRQEYFDEVDKPAMLPLPTNKYCYAEFKVARVGRGYHVVFDGTQYSVPYQLVRQSVNLKVTHDVVEIFHLGERIAIHERNYNGERVTKNEHMPSKHRYYIEFNSIAELDQLANIGFSIHEFAKLSIAEMRSKEQKYNFFRKLHVLLDRYTAPRLESACGYCNQLSEQDIQRLEKIILQNTDNFIYENESSNEEPFTHKNIRGPKYYS